MVKNQNNMEKYNWKLHLKISMLISFIIYLIVAFAYWDILIFKQLDDIGSVHRGFMALFYLTGQIFIAMYVSEYPIKREAEEIKFTDVFNKKDSNKVKKYILKNKTK